MAIKPLTLGFGSGQDLMVGWGLTSDSVLISQSLRRILSLSLSLSLSFSKINKVKKKKKEISVFVLSSTVP